MRIVFLLSLAVVAACSSSTAAPTADTPVTSQETDKNEPTTTDPTDPADAPEDAGTAEPPAKPAPKDAGTGDATKPATDAGTPGPTAFTKAEVQSLVNDRCAPCHIDFTSGGMSLANDFTTNTVNVASSEVPSMKRIAKGDHTKSYLWHKVNGTFATVGGSGARMPKNGTPLTATEIDRLAKYIDSL